ncbi:uncharacterized protein LOC121410443 [Lytechinus variegatus]|uniref:uncharacterized protein LOC121410443 n=1 Tax=Lytechinus variegatus TaxID=7654 RepID=UPI001BB27B5A|nr:uncharacterized protein LOC121410443 [Lytechinus variegatus]
MEIMGLSIFISLCSVLLLSLGAPKAEGCSCEGAHPQQHFCRASYVIGARVLKRDYIRKNSGGIGSSTGLLGSDHAAIEPLGERTRPYPGTGLHRLPDERLPDEQLGDAGRQWQDLEPLEPLPYPDGLEAPILPEAAEPIQNDGLFGPIPQSDGLGPLPKMDDLAPLPQPAGLQPLQQPDGLQPLPFEGGPEEMAQPEGLLPLPHPEGLQPLPEEQYKQDILPPLPLPEDLKPVEDTITTLTTSPPESVMTDGINTMTTLPPQEKPSNETVITEPVIDVEPTTEEERRIDPESMEAWNYKIIYTLKISHIYKTGVEQKGWKIGDEIELESPAATSLCGKTDIKTGKNYLIAGSRANRVVLCDWVQEHHKLTSRQKQGLKTVYGKSCDVCQIHSCTSSRHCKKPKQNRATTCLYDASQLQIGEPYSPYDCIASHSRCTLRHGHKCKWQKNNDYHKCVKHQLP